MNFQVNSLGMAGACGLNWLCISCWRHHENCFFPFRGGSEEGGDWPDLVLHRNDAGEKGAGGSFTRKAWEAIARVPQKILIQVKCA